MTSSVRIGWLADQHDPPGGAELTQAEFKAAAPEGVEVIDCPPGAVERCDRYVLHNHLTYQPADFIDLAGEVVRYHHDMRPQRVAGARSIFCSPLQGDALGLEGECVPPPIDLAAFRPTRQQRRHTERKGMCCVGAFLNPGKGGHLVAEYAAEHGEPIDVWGWGSCLPRGEFVNQCGPVEQRRLPELLAEYETFLFLPTALEPFGRCVVEAHAAGCAIVTNNLVGARYYLEEAPGKLASAAEDFWSAVLA